MFAHTLENVDHSLPATSMVSRTKKSRFDDAHFQKVYEQAIKYVTENKVLRLYQKLDLRSGFKTIIICNTWRIDRCLSSATIEAFEWSYQHKNWVQVRSVGSWPAVRLFPMQSQPKKISSKWFALEIIEKALLYALNASGFNLLLNGKKEDVSHYNLKNTFLARFVKWLHLEENAISISGAACALRKNIWSVVIDRPFLSIVCALNGWSYNLYLDRYMSCAMQADSVKRIACEHRNCLPLLPLIKPDNWKRLDLFSRKAWVKDGRKSTLIDRQGSAKSCRLSSFTTPATHRWLLAAPLTVVLEYVQAPNAVALENIASSNLPKRVPAIVLRALVKTSRKLSQKVLPEYQRIIRLWVLHCCELWQEQGYAHIRRIMEPLRYDFVNVLDWANAEGIARQLPDKNATWASIVRLSVEWHEQQAIHHARPTRGLTWESVLNDCEIDEFKIRALISSIALQKEGLLMHHCVGNYDDECYEGYVRIFSLTDNQGLCSTLSIEETGDGIWRVEQVRAVCNGPVSEETMKVANKVANRYTELSGKEVSSHETV